MNENIQQTYNKRKLNDIGLNCEQSLSEIYVQLDKTQ